MVNVHVECVTQLCDRAHLMREPPNRTTAEKRMTAERGRLQNYGGKLTAGMTF
jgi:hypothetical protein